MQSLHRILIQVIHFRVGLSILLECLAQAAFLAAQVLFAVSGVRLVYDDHGFLPRCMENKAKNTCMSTPLKGTYNESSVTREILNVCDEKVTDVNGSLSGSTCQSKNTLMKERSWIIAWPASLCFSLSSRHPRSVSRGACDCSARGTESAPSVPPS